MRKLTNEQIIEDSFYYEDLLEKKGNYSCVWCGGWALTCPCEENMFTKEEKEEICRYLELTDNDNIKI